MKTVKKISFLISIILKVTLRKGLLPILLAFIIIYKQKQVKILLVNAKLEVSLFIGNRNQGNINRIQESKICTCQVEKKFEPFIRGPNFEQ